MITNVANTSITSHNYYFLCGKNKIKSLSSCEVFNPVLLTVITMLCITSLELFYVLVISLYPITPSS